MMACKLRRGCGSLWPLEWRCLRRQNPFRSGCRGHGEDVGGLHDREVVPGY